MTRGNTLGAAIILFLAFSAGQSAALEKSLELGKDALWKDMVSFDGVTVTPGRYGLEDLVLSPAEYAVDPTTEFLFHFDQSGQSDSAGAYAYTGQTPIVSGVVSILGSGSAAFQADHGGVTLASPSGSAFAPGAMWQDFTIEFWAFPSLLGTGETLLSWQAAQEQSGGLGDQSIRVWIKDRRFVWDFQNIFGLPNGAWLPVAVSGTTRLLPRAWHHHLLRFDSRLGVLEYLLDGQPEGVVHTTDTGREGGSIALPKLSSRYPGQLVLGSNFTGYLDELRMSRAFVHDPVVQPLPATTGTATSRILDLGNTGTRIARIQSTYTAPSDSAAQFYYKVSDTWTNPKTLDQSNWTPFTPGVDFKDSVHGRYMQIMVELFPNGLRTDTPRVSTLTVFYEPNLPPTPPAALVATPGNGKVTLSWRKVNDVNVKGYRVFYGESPHTYLGTGALPGDSPIDAGDAMGIGIGNLQNGKLYYFAVASYDDSQPPQLSAFSPEVSARPSRILP